MSKYFYQLRWFAYVIFVMLLKVFDNYAVTVMIGGEPYTLGLFDTAGNTNGFENAFRSFLSLWNQKINSHISAAPRSGGLWQAASSQLSADGRVPCVFLCCLTIIFWKRQRKGHFESFFNSLKKKILTLVVKSIWISFQWVPEISHHCPRTPFLLVGTQVDLREDSNTIEKLAKNKQRPLYPDSGEKLLRELRGVKYVECSALTQVCVKFHTLLNWKQQIFLCLTVDFCLFQPAGA